MMTTKNLTRRGLLQTAMPLSTLSRTQWNAVLNHFTAVEAVGNDDLYDALQTLVRNQASIEVMSDYQDYFHDTMDEPVREEAIVDVQIA